MIFLFYYDRRTTTDVVYSYKALQRESYERTKTERRDETMISSDVIRGYNDTIILFLLWQEASYGYEISKQIRLLSEEKYIIKETTLYSAFTRLENNGYIESFYGDETNGKRRTYYRITDAGRAYYREKCNEWEITKQVVEKFIRQF